MNVRRHKSLLNLKFSTILYTLSYKEGRLYMYVFRVDRGWTVIWQK